MYTPGAILLWLAFIAGVASTVGFAGAVRRGDEWLRFARQSFWLMTAAIVAASALLMYLLLVHDYRLSYVWAYSDNALPTQYLISSFWGGQEGSFLLWVLCGVLMGLPLMRLAREYESRVMLFYNLTLVSLTVLMLKQSPFRFHQGLTQGTVPLDGQGLNPLLQNPWMVIHPPFMFVGYASLAIPFAFALAALWMRRYEDWTRITLPWALVSVATLGAAIMMGGYWSYETLGWGGYWGWDPVENASLVPWLISVALVHGMVLQKMSGRFRRLNLVLAAAAFVLVVYATFLTRSGVLSNFSVHSFVDLGITSWLVINIAVFVLLSAAFLVWRWREIPTEVGTEPFLSRTVFSVLAVLACVLIATIVLVGTSAPLITRLWGEPSQVGPSFYNHVGVWLAILLGALLGVTPYLGWKRAKVGAARKTVVSLVAAACVAAAALLLGFRSPLALVYLVAAVMGLVANTWATVDWVRAGRWTAAGGSLAHIGVAVMLVGFMTTGWLGREQRVELRQGRPVEVLGRTLTFRGIDKPSPMARDAMVVEVISPGGASSELRPRMWVNPKSRQLVANPDIRSRLTTDLYLAPVEYQPAGADVPGTELTLTRNQPAAYRDWTLTFTGFEMGEKAAEAAAMTVLTPVEVARPGREPVVVKPGMTMGADGNVQPLAVAVPDSGSVRVETTGMNVDEGRVKLEIIDPAMAPSGGAPAVFVVDVSTKPLIGAVWLGTVLVILGTLMALALRGRQVSALAVAPQSANGLPIMPGAPKV